MAHGEGLMAQRFKARDFFLATKHEPLRQAPGPPRSGAGVGVGMLMFLWFYGFVIFGFWFCGFMVLWFCGFMVCGFYGCMVLWLYLFVLLFNDGHGCWQG